MAAEVSAVAETLEPDAMTLGEWRRARAAEASNRRIAERLVTLLRQSGGWVNASDLRRRLTLADRPALSHAINLAKAAGLIDVEPIPPTRSRPGTRYRARRLA